MHESTSSSYHQFINATSGTRLSKKSRAAVDLMSNVSISRSNDRDSKHCARKKFHLDIITITDTYICEHMPLRVAR
jgi:hypothetical protein